MRRTFLLLQVLLVALLAGCMHHKCTDSAAWIRARGERTFAKRGFWGGVLTAASKGSRGYLLAGAADAAIPIYGHCNIACCRAAHEEGRRGDCGCSKSCPCWRVTTPEKILANPERRRKKKKNLNRLRYGTPR